MFDFEKFIVYKKTELFLKEIQPLLKSKTIDLSLKNQFYRASTSIILNIAEGSGKFSKKDKKNFYTIARGSSQECVSIINILRLEGNIKKDLYDSLYQKLDEICRMLTGLIKSLI